MWTDVLVEPRALGLGLLPDGDAVDEEEAEAPDQELPAVAVVVVCLVVGVVDSYVRDREVWAKGVDGSRRVGVQIIHPCHDTTEVRTSARGASRDTRASGTCTARSGP